MKKLVVFVYKFKHYLFIRTLPGNCCWTAKAALSPLNFRDLRKLMKKPNFSYGPKWIKDLTGPKWIKEVKK